ncbi:MAG: hypothetical protein KAV82_07025 [Phycisphaerae bacterium]|nr:hypothetical protein [Phycisphaerae bacterium]
MASKSLRRYDVQAKVSLIITILASFGLVVLITILGRNYNSELRAIMYGSESIYAPLVMLGTAGISLLSLIGLVLGFNSAGQRRNNMQTRSWVAFFLGTAVLAGAVICLAMFWILKMKL